MATLDDKFIVKLNGKEFVMYNGLVDLAHQEGLLSLEVDLLQIPSKDNEMVAIAKATAKTKDKLFIDVGDAGPKSTNSMILPHIIRMASTRAKARALRDLTNVGMTAIEELSDEERKEDKSSKSNNQSRSNYTCSECSKGITQGVNKVSTNKHGKPLCIPCQNKIK